MTYLDRRYNEDLGYKNDQCEEISVEESNIMLEKDDNKALISINGISMAITRPSGLNENI